MHNKIFEPWRHQECRARITERTSLGEKFTNGTVLFLNCYFSFYERSIEMVFEMFGEKSKQYYTTLHYNVFNHTSLHYTTWPCTSLDCTVSCAHNRCGRPGRGEAGYWNTLPPLGTALDRRGLSQLDYLGHCPLAWHCPTGVHPPYYLELAPSRERCSWEEKKTFFYTLYNI